MMDILSEIVLFVFCIIINNNILCFFLLDIQHMILYMTKKNISPKLLIKGKG